MLIISVTIENFRCFDKLSIDFDDQLTVLVGANDSGKSSVLDALSFLLQPIMEQQLIDNNMSIKFNITSDDISIGSSLEQIHFSYIISLNNAEYTVNYKIFFNPNDPDNFRVETDPLAAAFFDSYNSYLLNRENLTNIFVFYDAVRSVDTKINPNPGIDFSTRNHEDMAFLNAFSSRIDYISSQFWFDSVNVRELRIREALKDFNFEIPQLSAVRRAVIMALEADGMEFEDLRIDGHNPELHVTTKKTGKSYKISQLGEGYRIMLAMVLDLSRRMVAANDRFDFKDPDDYLKTPAIVLIDEIDLHLFPSWQQCVLPKLLGIFPNTQFIVTTQSPQVLTSIKRHHIRVLQQGDIYFVSTNTYGAFNSDVMEEVLQVPCRPKNNEVTQKMDQYIDLINNGLGKGDDALKIRSDLEELMPNDPFFVKADLYMKGFKSALTANGKNNS
jgi:predicted ATP-binding protein involved in virulence